MQYFTINQYQGFVRVMLLICSEKEANEGLQLRDRYIPSWEIFDNFEDANSMADSIAQEFGLHKVKV